jgi:hypothetical protein
MANVTPMLATCTHTCALLVQWHVLGTILNVLCQHRQHATDVMAANRHTNPKTTFNIEATHKTQSLTFIIHKPKP